MLTAATGAWAGDLPLVYAYQWQRCDPTGASCAPITAASAQTYTLVPADLGATIRVAVSTTNAAGSATATSAATPVVVDTYRNTVLADAPLAYWRLDEPSGATSAADASGHGLDSTYFNGVGLGVTGALASDPDTAASLDGVDDRLNRAIVTTQVANVTLEAWINHRGVPGNPLLVYNGNSGLNGYGLQLSLGFGLSCGTGDQLFVIAGGVACDAAGSAGLIPANEWVYVAATRSADGTWTLYVNGEAKSTGTVTPNVPAAGGTSIGDEFDGGVGGASPFAGRIDEVAIYNSALSAARIMAHFRAARPPTLAPLTPTLEQGFGQPGAGMLARNPTGSFAEPVNSASGSYYTSVTDLALPGIGLPFELTRSYNSADTSSGPLGIAWTHSDAASLTTKANGDVVVRSGDGQQLAFTRRPDGTFAGGVGARSSLRQLLDGYELLRHDQVRYRFDPQGRLTSLRERNGQGLTLAYDASGRLQTLTDSVGRIVNFTHNPAGLLTKVALPDGRSVSYAYTGGRLTSVVDVRGGTTSYGYDANGRLATIVDANGHTVVQNTYGADGRAVAQLDALGNRTTFLWDAATQTATATDARGNAWKDVYQNNVLIQRIDPLGNAVSFGYDADLNRTAVTDARGNTTTMSYDARGNMLSRTAPAPLLHKETFTYDAQNNLLSATDGRGNTTTYAYDAAGNLIKVTEPGLVVTQYGLDPAGSGLVKSVTDPRGKVTRLDYDLAGNLARLTSPLGAVTTMGYDAAGRLVELVEPRGNAPGADPLQFRTTFAYDAAGNLLRETDPLGNATTFTYDAVGNLASKTDANGHTTGYGYDAANRLVSVTAPDGTVTVYTYDGVANLTSRTDANGHLTTYGYDPASRLTSVTSPLGQRWSYGYDASGNLTLIVDANGNATPAPGDGATAFGYDALNRLVAIDYSDTTPDLAYAYDANGNRTTMTDGAGTETYAYDPLDRLVSVSRGTDSFAYAYDAVGDLTRRTYPDGSSFDYLYDDEARLTSLTSGTQTTSYSYDVAGNLLRTVLPPANGFVETRSYDRAGRLTEVRNAKGATTLSLSAYTLDPVGNPLSVTTTKGTLNYRYDGLDRLVEACFAVCGPTDPFIRYSYDRVGNRTSAVVGNSAQNGTFAYAYDAADQLLSQTSPLGTIGYAYDQDGNETRAGTRSLAYDLANRLISTTRGLRTTTYAYDGDGKRLRASSGTRTTSYLWDVNAPLPQLALERDGAGTTLRSYTYGVDLVSMTTGGQPFYYHRDALGSTTDLTSSTGVPQWAYAYEPFGVTIPAKLRDTAPENPIGFTGQYLDFDTGLYHLRARQYDPTTGRFLQIDPLTPQLTDPYVAGYVYANNRPTVFIDPSGMGAVLAGGATALRSPAGICVTCVGRKVIGPVKAAGQAVGRAVVTAAEGVARVGRAGAPSAEKALRAAVREVQLAYRLVGPKAAVCSDAAIVTFRQLPPSIPLSARIALAIRACLEAAKSV